MPFQFLRQFVGPLSKLNIVTSVPMIFLLVGLQAIVDLKFSCPCKVERNTFLPSVILCVPFLIAFLIMFIFLRPCQYKCDCSKGKNNSGTSQGQDNSGTSQSEHNECEENYFHCVDFLVCFIPGLVWICLFFIDGDYLACLETDWDGQYACHKELHPNCLNWCKPNKITLGKNETECFNRTQELIHKSKIIGYVLAILFCILGIFVLSVDCSKSGSRNKDHKQQDIEEQPEQRTDSIQLKTIENANEDTSLLSTQATTSTKSVLKEKTTKENLKDKTP